MCATDFDFAYFHDFSSGFLNCFVFHFGTFNVRSFLFCISFRHITIYIATKYGII